MDIMFGISQDGILKMNSARKSLVHTILNNNNTHIKTTILKNTLLEILILKLPSVAATTIPV